MPLSPTALAASYREATQEAIVELRRQADHFRRMATQTSTKNLADMLITKSQDCERDAARLERMPKTPASLASALSVIKRPTSSEANASTRPSQVS
jgi:hypothetical protein